MHQQFFSANSVIAYAPLYRISSCIRGLVYGLLPANLCARERERFLLFGGGFPLQIRISFFVPLLVCKSRVFFCKESLIPLIARATFLFPFLCLPFFCSFICLQNVIRSGEPLDYCLECNIQHTQFHNMNTTTNCNPQLPNRKTPLASFPRSPIA